MGCVPWPIANIRRAQGRQRQAGSGVPSQTVERLQRSRGGVHIWGGDIVRLSQQSSAVGIFGAVAPELDLPTTPAFDAGTAAERIRQAEGTNLVVAPELTILAMKRGGYALVFTAVLADARFTRVFIDAQTGEALERYSEMRFQSAIGTGRGVLGDTEKISVLQQNGTFVTSDTHRPPTLNTYDMRGDLRRAKAVLIGGALTAAISRATATTTGRTQAPLTRTRTSAGPTTTSISVSAATAWTTTMGRSAHSSIRSFPRMCSRCRSMTCRPSP